MAIELAGIPVPPKQVGCLFCYPDQAPPTPHFAQWQGWANRSRVGNLAEITLFESKNLRVIPDSFPVRSSGQHALIVDSSSHAGAYAHPEDLGAEVEYVIHRLRQESKGPVIVGEHGAGLPQFGHAKAKIQSILHRHLHLIWGDGNGRDPIRFMLEFLREKGWFPTSIDMRDVNTVSILKKLYSGNPYLFLSDGSRGIWLEDPADAMPSMTIQGGLGENYSGRALSWKKIPEDPILAREATARIMNLMSLCDGTGLFTAR